jgi:hypothetical protein
MPLPARHEHSAPSFDENRPEEVDRYFTDLDDLLTANGVAGNDECKQAAVKYLKEVSTEKLWKSSPAWSDATKTFAEFKREILRLYPASSEDRSFTIQDLDRLIGERARVGIFSTNDVGNYFRQFLLITRYLIGKSRMSTTDQSRNFLRGFQPEVVHLIQQRLQLRNPNHFPDDPYPVYDVANFVIGGPTQNTVFSGMPLPPTYQPSPYQPAAPPAADPTTVKLEALTTAVASLGEMFKMVLETQQGGGKPRNAAPRPAAGGGAACNFCGGASHFIRECEVVAEYSQASKCKRSADGKVVLPSGAMVPRDTPGTWMRDRVDEWHRQNPGQTASQMILEVAAVQTATAPAGESVSQSYIGYPAQHVVQGPEVSQPGLYALRRVPAPRPDAARQRPARENTAPAASSSGGGDAATSPFKRELPPHLTREDPSPVKHGKTVEIQEVPDTSHPYTRDAVGHNASAAPVAPAVRKPDQAYTTTAKIHDDKVAAEIYNRAMEIPITVTQRELLSLAPELRAKVADATLKRRIPREPAQVVQVMLEEIEDPEAPSKEEVRLSHMPAAFATAAHADTTATTDSYLRAVPEPADTQEEVEVAAESNALRAILPIVDGQERVESILDPGCQVVAMSEEVCNALAIAYDPSVTLSMVSTNGGVDQSLGLARNVAFSVGDMTLYLQVHILCSPAYDILLGCPFDILTQSVVRNYRDENQTITIRDPNTIKSVTVPTIARGTHRFADRRARAKSAASVF